MFSFSVVNSILIVLAMVKISTYNCQSSKRNAVGISQLCQDSDVIFLQEHWLFPSDLSSLNSIHPDFISFGLSAMDPSTMLMSGRPYGGVAVLWRKGLTHLVKPVTYDDDRIIGLEFRQGETQMLFLGVYLPYCAPCNFESYVHYLGKIGTILNKSDTPYVCILGDFNADMAKMTEFGTELASFCDEARLLVADSLHLPSDSKTHVNDGHGSESWLDHIVCTKVFFEMIVKVDINNSIHSSDHFPVSIHISHDNNVQPIELETAAADRWIVDWTSLSPEELKEYTTAVGNNLVQLAIPYELLNCEMTCSDSKHHELIDTYYDNIIACIQKASQITVSKKVGGKFKRNIPGWNDFVRDEHAILCDVYALWALVGKPREGYIHCQLRLARSRFKYALRKCLSQEKELRAKALADRLVANPHNTSGFWKEVNKLNSSSPLAPSVGGISGEDNIASMWKEHFSEILNSVCNTECKALVEEKLSAAGDKLEPFSVREVSDSIRELSSGRSSGNDFLSAEHIKFAGSAVAAHLSLCFTMIAKHMHLPDKLTKVVLTPIVKDKTSSLTAKDNYRPIAVASVCSKVLERVILNRCSAALNSGHHQFGFKEKHSSDMAIFALKEISDYFVRNNSPVFICFLDARKAFDRVNHWTLFNKLLVNGMDPFLVKLLRAWYKSQRFHVRWGNALSTGFYVSNGVRQGGIISPHLFNVYTDGLSTLLDQSGVGCHYLGSLNHLYYADDMVILSPTPHGLQKLLNICSEYAKDHDILFNTKKTVCMSMLPAIFRNISLPDIFLCDSALSYVDEYKYLGYRITSTRAKVDDHEICHQYRSLCCRANSLSRKFALCSYSVKKYLYNTYCSNISYMHLWHSYHISIIRKFKVCYNNAARMFLGYPKYCSASGMFVQEGVNGFDAAYRKAVWNFLSRLGNSENRIMSTLYDGDIARTSPMRKAWSVALYGYHTSVCR